MDVIRKKLRAIQRWLAVVRFGENAVRLFFYALCVFSLLVLADRLIYLNLDLYQGLFWMTGLALLGAAAWVVLARITLMKAAHVADDELGLKERLSSTLALGEAMTPMEQALVLDTAAKAKHLVVTRTARFHFPRESRFFYVPAALIVLSLMVLPPMDLLGRLEAKTLEDSKKDQAKKDGAKIEKRVAELKKLAQEKKLPQLDGLIKKMDELANDVKALKTDKVDAMAKLSSMTEELKDRKEKLGDKMALKRDLESLSGEEGEIGNLANSLKSGDYEQAREEMKKLQQKMNSGSLTPEEKQKLQRQLQQLAKSLKNDRNLERLGKSLEKLAEKLEKSQEQLNEEDREYASKAFEELEDQMKTLEELSEEELEELEKQLDEMEDMKDELSGEDGEDNQEGQEGQEGDRQGQEGDKQGQQGEKQGQQGEKQGQQGEKQGQQGKQGKQGQQGKSGDQSCINCKKKVGQTGGT